MDPRIRYLQQRRKRRGGTPPDPFATVTRDATSGIYVPASAAEWTTFIAAAGLSIAVPDALWLMQEASGNPADSIGSLTLTASGIGITYQQSVTGWTRKAIKFADANTSQLRSTGASLPDVSTASQLTLLLAQLAVPSSTAKVMAHGTVRNEIRITTTPRLRAQSNGNIADGSVSPTGSVIPIGLRSRAAVSVVGFSDTEKLTPTLAAVTGKAINFGAVGDATAPPISLLYAVQWHNANAEMSDANYKLMLQALGCTITWS